MNRESSRPAITEHELIALAQRIVQVPDKLATVQMCLEPLCNGNTEGLSPEARKSLSEACRLLHSAITDVVELAHDLRGLPALDRKTGTTDGASPP